ncbi:MAG: lactonase family protein [Gemella sp.]|nr:lactonase family protein [Gemella sp.]
MEKFYLGTYTKRESKGIYSVELDTVNKKLLNLKLEQEATNPTYLSTAGTNIYSVSGKGDLGGLSVFSADTRLDLHTEKSVPCHISYNKEKNIILTSNYHIGTLGVYTTSDNEIKILDKVEHNLENDEVKSHLHYADWSLDKQFIFACDLGKDALHTYRLVDNKLELVSSYKSAQNAGPRHIVQHPTLDVVYLICELDASVEVLSLKDGSFELVEKINLLENQEDKKWAAAVKLSNNAKYLYASNRGKNVLVAYSVLEDGKLEKIASYDTQGSVPRDFAISSNDRFIIVGHQESDNLTLFEVKENGKLELLEKDFYAPEVVCVK